MTLIKIVNGDLLDAEENLILHQVNCQGEMNTGVAEQVRKKWRRVFEKYNGLATDYRSNPSLLLGNVQSILVNDRTKQYVVNMFSQDNFGYDGERHTNYEALYVCLEKIAIYARRNNYSVALPYLLGCDRGGAKWSIVYAMIEEAFKNHTQPIVIYNINGQYQHSFRISGDGSGRDSVFHREFCTDEEMLVTLH